MKEGFQAEKEISIVEILKVLLSKIVYLVLAFIIGAGVGAAFGYVKATGSSSPTWKMTTQFYVQPVPKDQGPEGESIYGSYGSYSTNVMRNMIQLLETEMFASSLLDDMMGYNEQTNKAENPNPDLDGLPKKKYDPDNKKTGGFDFSYESWLNKITKNVNFAFKYENNIAESFITVNVSWPAASKSAEAIDKAEVMIMAIYEEVTESVTKFVEDYMPKPTGYVATKCGVVEVINKPAKGTTVEPKDEAKKFAIVVGALGLIVAAILVIASYMSDKRLRDVEDITKVFNLPVLGVIPAIDEKKMSHNSKNKGGKA